MSRSALGETRRQLAVPCVPLPRVQIGGPGIAGGMPETNGPSFRGVRSVADAAAKVEETATAGFQWLAVHDAHKFLPGELDAIGATARARGLRIFAAAASNEELAAVLSIRPHSVDYIVREDERYSREMVVLLRRSGATLVPSIGYLARAHRFAGNARLLEDESHFEFMSAERRAHALSAARADLGNHEYVLENVRTWPTIPQKFAQLLSTGLPIGAGTDAGSPVHFHAGAIWEELRALRALGLSLSQTLAAATTEAAKLLAEPDAGEIRVGARADFVIYKGRIDQGTLDGDRVLTVAMGGIIFVDNGRWVGP